MKNHAVALAAAVLALTASSCASDPEARPPVAAVFGLSTLSGAPPDTTVLVRPAAGDPAFRPAGAAPTGDPAVSVPSAGSGHVVAYTIETRITDHGPGGQVISAPRLTVYPGQRANVSVVNQTSFIQDFDTERAGEKWLSDPIVGILQDGLVIDLLAAPSARGWRTVDLGFRVQLVELEHPIRQRSVAFARHAVSGTIQLPRLAIASVSGVRSVGIGDTVRIAELPGGTGGSPVDVEVRVVPTVLSTAIDDADDDLGLSEFLGRGVTFETPDPLPNEDQAPDLRRLVSTAAARGQAAGRLTLEPVLLGSELELGVALDEAAVRRTTPRTAQRSLRSMAVATAPVPGVEVRALLQESYLKSYDTVRADDAPGETLADPVVDTLLAGVTGIVEEGGVLRLEWTMVASLGAADVPVADGFAVSVEVPDVQTHRLRVPLRAGRQLVPVAHVVGGGTAAVWVGFLPVE